MPGIASIGPASPGALDDEERLHELLDARRGARARGRARPRRGASGADARRSGSTPETEVAFGRFQVCRTVRCRALAPLPGVETRRSSRLRIDRAVRGRVGALDDHASPRRDGRGCRAARCSRRAARAARRARTRRRARSRDRSRRRAAFRRAIVFGARFDGERALPDRRHDAFDWRTARRAWRAAPKRFNPAIAKHDRVVLAVGELAQAACRRCRASSRSASRGAARRAARCRRGLDVPTMAPAGSDSKSA